MSKKQTSRLLAFFFMAAALLCGSCGEDPDAGKFAPPVLTLGEAVADTTHATLTCSVSGKPDSFDECWFSYTLSADFVDLLLADANISDDAFSASISNLTPDTTYYYKAFATNGKDTVSSESGVFITDTIPAKEPDPEDPDDPVDPPADPSEPLSEREALMAFFSETGGPTWVNKTYWGSDADIGTWYGVTVEEGHVTKIDLGYNNLQGKVSNVIKYLPYLTYFDIGSNPWEEGNNITSVDVSGNPALTYLDCGNLQITSIDLSHNAALKTLYMREAGSLTFVDVSHCPDLDMFFVDGCGLTSVDFSANPKLSYIECENNQISSIDVSHNPLLRALFISGNPIASINLTSSPLLEIISCGFSHISSLDLSKNLKIEEVVCPYCELSELDLTNNPRLNALECRGNNLTELDISHNIELLYIWSYDNKIDNLDIRLLDKLETKGYTSAVYVGNQRDDNGDLKNMTLTMTQKQKEQKWIPLWSSYEKNAGVAVVEEESINLSENGCANCYIVQCGQKYSFYAGVKGNSSETIDFSSAVILWRSVNVYDTGNDLITDFSYDTQMKTISFSTYESNVISHLGNAVIGVLDADGRVLWSWHIWVAGFNPEITCQTYGGSNGPIMMDRNLGALTESVGISEVFGMMYQWGRKDPFRPSASEAKGNTQYIGTVGREWNSVSMSEASASSSVTDYSVSHPMTFITSYEAVSGSWAEEKTMYDPCPLGWKVPSSNVWAGFPSSIMFYDIYSYVFFEPPYTSGIATYPAQGLIDPLTGNLSEVGQSGYLWSVPTVFRFNMDSSVSTAPISTTAPAYAVRCQKE